MSINDCSATPSGTDIDQSIERYSKQNFSASSKSSASRLLGFSAVAAGGLLAGSQAEADIQYSGLLNQSVTRGQSTPINVDGVGGTEFNLFHAGSVGLDDGSFAIGGFSGGFDFMNTGPTAGIYRGATSMGDASTAQMFSAGSVGWMGQFTSSAIVTNAWGVFSNQNEGVTQTGIFGFQFNGQTGGGGTGQMFGWMKVQLRWDDLGGPGMPGTPNGVPGINDDTTMTLVSFAYEDSGGAIHFGQVPEPSSAGAIALLALGAAGIRRRRRQND